MASLTERLDRFQRRHPWAGMPLAVAYKFAEDQGIYLTSLITYYGFLSLFPLLLLMVTVLGFLLAGNPDLQQRLVDSALSRFPVIGDQIGENVHTLQGNTLALVVGIVVTVYGALGVAQVTQSALNRIWGVPRNMRPNPMRARLRSALLLVVIGAGVVLTSILSAVTAGADTVAAYIGGLQVLVALVGLALGIAVNALLFILAFRILTARDVSWRAHLPGALGGAVAWQLLQVVGTLYVRNALQGATATYGLFGIVLGLLAWIYLGALTVVVAAEVNVVRARRLWPRSLMTPFTDDVELTQADERAYRSYARSERHKGFETVDVRFDRRRDPAPDGEPEPDRAAEPAAQTSEPADRGAEQHGDPDPTGRVSGPGRTDS